MPIYYSMFTITDLPWKSQSSDLKSSGLHLWPLNSLYQVYTPVYNNLQDCLRLCDLAIRVALGAVA